MSRAERVRAKDVRRKRRFKTSFALIALIVFVIGAVFVGSRFWHGMFGSDTDYQGEGVKDVVIEVHNGDSTTVIGQTLHDHEVVATVSAFVQAASGSSAMSSIQPGFYKVRTEIPSSDAVARLSDPQNRVGRLVIPEGRQLDDIADKRTNDVTPGIFAMIASATCMDLDGTKHCVNADDLRQAAGTADPSALSIPAWALDPVKALGKDHRRIEGLIAPGTWNVDPSASAPEILASLISASTAQYEANGLLEAGKAANLSPYQILTVASLVQRESKPDDFAKVARVIYNRLVAPDHSRLEFDSTVNYPLDRQEVATRTRTARRRHRGIPMCAKDFRRRRSARPVNRRWRPRRTPRQGTGCTSSPWTSKARRSSPGTTRSTSPTSNWRRKTVSSTAPHDRAQGCGAGVADLALPLAATPSRRVPRVGARRLELRPNRVHRRRIALPGRWFRP